MLDSLADDVADVEDDISRTTWTIWLKLEQQNDGYE